MRAPVVVFAVGNPSRGDDALGPHLSERLADWLEKRGRAGEAELIDDFQLQIEHALDLEGRELALFIDAGEGTPAPFRFYRAFPDDRPMHSSHALPPESVLQVHARTLGGEGPPAYVLCVRGDEFELGEGLSAAARENAGAAFAFLADLFEAPGAERWGALESRSPG